MLLVPAENGGYATAMHLFLTVLRGVCCGSLALGVVLCGKAQAPTAPIAVHAAHLFDGDTAALTGPVTVTVAGGTIPP